MAKQTTPQVWAGTYRRAVAHAQDTLTLTLKELRELVEATHAMGDGAIVTVKGLQQASATDGECYARDLYVREEKTVL